MASVWTEQAVGPASYTTGGFVITTDLATLTFFDVRVNIPGANLGQSDYDVTLNSPAAGQATVKVLRSDTDPITTVGSPSGLPAGVVNRTTSGGITDAQPTHVHSIDHDHAVSPSSSVPTAPAGAILVAAAQPAATAHTHVANLPALGVVNSGAESGGNTHTWNNLYSHTPVLTNTQTDIARNELAAATNLSGTTFNYLGTDG